MNPPLLQLFWRALYWQRIGYPTQSKGLGDSQMKAEMEMRSGIIASRYQHFSFRYVCRYMLDAHLRGKYFDFMNTNGCSQ